MSVEAPPVIDPPEAEPEPTHQKSPGCAHWLWRAVVFPAKFLWGVFFCSQTILTSLLVIGWSYRLAQRTAYKHWWKRSNHRAQGGEFTEFAMEDEATAGHAHSPNWFVQQNFRSLFSAPKDGSWAKHLWSLFKGFTTSFRSNLVLGIQGALNTLALTLPSGLMWWFGWDYGWNISFYKGYEQSLIGTGLFLIGSLFFIGVMFYLPLAQARQAVTGNWRTFWDVNLVIRIIRSQWVWILLLSGLIGLLSVSVLILKTAPALLSEALKIETVEQATEFLKKYFFWSAMFVLPSYVTIRVLSAKIYAHGLLYAVQNNNLELDELAPSERAVLERLDLHKSKPPVLKHWFWKIASWMGSRIGQFISAAILFWIWLGLVSAIVVTEFLIYHEAGRGWWNQQLIQLPWFNYMPTYIQPIGGEVAGAIFLSILVLAGRYVINFIKETIRHRQLPD